VKSSIVRVLAAEGLEELTVELVVVELLDTGAETVVEDEEETVLGGVAVIVDVTVDGEGWATSKYVPAIAATKTITTITVANIPLMAVLRFVRIP
jgi:hypothetical protein